MSMERVLLKVQLLDWILETLLKLGTRWFTALLDFVKAVGFSWGSVSL